MDPRRTFGHPPARPPGGPRFRPPLPGGSFSARVMARVASEPRPTPARSFVRAVGHLALRDAVAALMTAWRLTFEPSAAVSAPTRARAAALLVSFVLLVGIGAPLLTSGGLAILSTNGPTLPQFDVGAPVESPAVDPLTRPLPDPSPAVSPSPAPEPSPPTSVETQPQADAAEIRPNRQPAAAGTDEADLKDDDLDRSEKREREPERERDDVDDD